ncbi:MAG: acetyl/propionyl/methylcrotonyl-CoA carboxylase subunit alpha [Alphaproteobacteria bacterium]
MFTSLLIANRGEIACRIIRTARDMGLRTVAVFSQADAGALHVEMAHEARAIGPSPSAQSYLRGEVIIATAKAARVEAIHPGYGFLAENADFAQMCADAGIIFVGPSPDAIRAMGAKDGAKWLMIKAGVPVVPGYHGAEQEAEFLAGEAQKIGYPVLIKASMGGGGKGMRRVDEPSEFAAALASAQREARAAFGNDHVLVEKFIAQPRHIEVQIFADRHGNAVHMFERDCSLQRRHQKVIEEAPAPGMTPGLRAAMCEAAIASARAVAYEGAGTVEFIVDGTKPLGDETQFYFMEMNTRLQVEHPVTEMVTGLDLVALQLQVAAGEALPVTQDDIKLSGHAVEARLYAENPATGFLPETGKLLAFRGLNSSDDSRLEAGVREGDEITGFYDPMIAKLVAWGPNRKAAFARADAALADLAIAGPATNQAFLRLCLAHDGFANGTFDTGLIDRELKNFIAFLDAPDEKMLQAGVRALVRRAARSSQNGTGGPWTVADGFQLGPVRRHTVVVEAGGDRHTLGVAWADGEPQMDIPGDAAGITIVGDGDGVIAVAAGKQLRVRLADHFQARSSDDAAQGALTAPMPGRVSLVGTAAGQKIAAGEMIVVLEAMKMEHIVAAPFDGVVETLSVALEDQVAKGAVLAVVAPLSPADP